MQVCQDILIVERARKYFKVSCSPVATVQEDGYEIMVIGVALRLRQKLLGERGGQGVTVLKRWPDTRGMHA